MPRLFVLVLFCLGASSLQAATIYSKTPRSESALHVVLHEGLTEREIPLPGREKEESVNDGIAASWELGDRNGHLQTCRLVIENRSDRERKLEPGLRWEIPASAPFQTFWDGSVTERAIAEIQEPLRQASLRKQAPWAAVYGEEEAVMVGLHPGEIRSYLRSDFEPGKERNILACSTRLVLAPGQREAITFVFAEYPIRYGGQRETVQRIHQAFPEVYTPSPNVNPAIYGVSAQYYASRMIESRIPGYREEILRRMYATWDWCYTPFKRAGDHWGHEAYWDYKPHRPFREHVVTILNRQINFEQTSREEFLKLRKQYFDSFKNFRGVMFYSPAGTWIEEQLAREKHSDALIEDSNYAYRRSPWVTPYDQEVKVLAWYTSVEERLKEDFTRIASEYPIGGVAMDVARGGPKYRGPATQKPLTIRAYDEQGIFIDQGVGVAKFIEFLHTFPLKTDPTKHLAVVGNPETGGQTYTVTARYDAGMFEGPPYHPHNENIPLARYILGSKPLTWWLGWSYQRIAVPNWRQQTQAEFIKTMKGLCDYVIFASYEYAALPTLVDEFGVPKLTREIPTMIDSIRRGWLPVVPVRHDFTRELHMARYGQGLSTRLFFGNPYDEASPFAFRVDHDYLPTLVWAARHQKEPLTTKMGARETAIQTTLPSRTPALFDAVAELPAGFEGEVESRFEHSLIQQELKLTIQPANADSGTTIRFARPEGFRAPLVSVNGGKPEVVEDELKLPRGKVELQVLWRADWAGDGIETVAEWNLFDENGNPAVEVVCSGEEKEEAMRHRLGEYFGFYSRVALNKGSAAPVRFVKPDEASPEARKLVLRESPDASNTVSIPSSREILLSYRSTQDGERILDRFLRLLDQKYPYYPGFLGLWGMGHDLLQHVDMVGKTIE